MSDVVTRNVKLILNKAIVLFTSRVVITKLVDESKVIFRTEETCSKNSSNVRTEKLQACVEKCT